MIINIKMPTIVGILTFFEHDKSYAVEELLPLHDKFYAQLSTKKFYNIRARLCGCPD